MKILFAFFLAATTVAAWPHRRPAPPRPYPGKIVGDTDLLRAFVKGLKLPAERKEIVASAVKQLPQPEAHFVETQLRDKKYWSTEEVFAELSLNLEEEKN